MTETSKRVKRPAPRRPIITRYSRWFRMYASVRHDPKILGLSERQRWHWLCILSLAAEHEQGHIPPPRTLAFELRCTPAEAEQTCSELIDAGLIEAVTVTDPASPMRPHNWLARQYSADSSTERSRRHRERKRQQTDATQCNDVQRCSNVPATKVQRPRSDSVSDSVPVFTVALSEEEKTVKEDTRASNGTNVAKWVGPDDEEVM